MTFTNRGEGGRQKVRILGIVIVTVLLLFSLPKRSDAGAYIFAGESNGIDSITHPMGYDGSGGELTISIGIDPTSANAADMQISVQNMVYVFNQLSVTTGNLFFGGSNNIPSGAVDFESVALHELGHAMGLAHANLASESGLPQADQNYTKSTDGVNNVYDINPGIDGIKGSYDDIRGDDVNLHWFKIADNDPFTIAGTVDSTSYSRDLADLPAGDDFAANADRTVGADFGYPNTEAVMQQLSYSDEAQRTLAADDVATLRLGMSGIDEVEGTVDDYTFTLVYAGLDAGADIVLDFDNDETGFAVTQMGGSFLGAGHVEITSAMIYFNAGYNWFFNDAAAAGVASIGLCNPASNTFFLKNDHSGGAADVTFRYGPAGADWIPLAGNWDGDGDDTIGLYNPISGTFFLKNDHSGGAADVTFRYGPAGADWIPLAGNWDGDGDDTIGLYNPISGTFFLKNDHSGGAADVTFRYGPAGADWTPLAGDWNGDGDDTIGLYNPISGTFFLKNEHSGGAADVTFRFGPAGADWTPLAGDWNGDGVETVGLYNPISGTFFLKNDHSGGAADVTFRYGPAGADWTPLTGDWDGN